LKKPLLSPQIKLAIRFVFAKLGSDLEKNFGVNPSKFNLQIHIPFLGIHG
jgi:hypothetical protein